MTSSRVACTVTVGELAVLLDRAVLRARHVVEAAAAGLLAQAVDVVQHERAARPRRMRAGEQ